MSQSYKPKKSSQEVIFTVLRQISYTKLFKKYTSGNFSFNKICINNLIFNENCLVVSRFKDFLIYDDNTEFFRRFYPIKDSFPKLEHILNFYEKYSKIFPNYLVIKENKYLYKNIRKKQKMIDALNELKREERENREKLKSKEYSKDKRNQRSQLNELFTKNIKKEIKNYQKNISFQNYKNSFDSDTDINNEDTLLINQNSISIYYKQLKEEKDNKYKDEINAESFVTNQTNGSISNIVNVLNDNKLYICDLPNILAQSNTNTNNTNNTTQKNKINKKPSGKKESNHNSVKAFNRNTNKEEIEFQPTKHIRNNSLIKRKKIADKNNLYKNALTSTNATNSSSILSKKIKNQQTSPVNRATKDNIRKSIENNNDKNLYQKTTPNFSHFELSKKNKQANNNEPKKIEDKSSKENIQIIKADNPKKEKYKINKEVVKKKYIKCKHISQDFDSNLYSKMTENILNKNSKLNTNENSLNMNMLNTENIIYQTCKNLVTPQNPNLITGDTKSNDRNEKNFMEDKLIVNVRDKIEKEKETEKEKEKEIEKEIEKEKEKEEEKKNKKEFLTEQKPKTNKKNKSIFKLMKSNPSSKGVLKTKTFNIKDTKIKLFNTLENNNNNNLKYKKTIEVIYEQDNYKNSMLRNKSAIAKQKTEIKFGNKNKKFLTKDQKTKTKALFANKLKFLDKSKKLLKSMENVSKSKGVFKRINKNKDKDKEKEKSKTKEISINNSKKLFDIKFGSRHDIKNKNSSEKGMVNNLSDVHIYKYKSNFTPYKSQTKKSRLNTRLTNCDSDKKYKSFLVKTKSKVNEVFNRNSHKEFYPFNFINKLQTIKQNKTNNDFYHTLKIKSSKFINMDNSSNSVNKVKNNRNSSKMVYNGSFITTPNIKNKNNNFFKNHLSKRLNNNINRNKKKDEINNNCLSSFSIKVNKTHYNKNEERNSHSKSKNLKKTWTKNMNNLINQIENNI